MSLRQRWLMCGTRSLSPGLHAWLGPGCHFLRPSRQLLGHSKAGIAHQTWLLDRAERERAGGSGQAGAGRRHSQHWLLGTGSGLSCWSWKEYWGGDSVSGTVDTAHSGKPHYT